MPRGNMAQEHSCMKAGILSFVLKGFLLLFSLAPAFMVRDGLPAQ